jgi:hypothetical protein
MDDDCLPNARPIALSDSPRCGDPVGAGVVPNLARPGGNATGFSMLATELSAKRLEILREIAPNTSPVAMLWNDTNPGMTLRAHESERAAATPDGHRRISWIGDPATINPRINSQSQHSA